MFLIKNKKVMVKEVKTGLSNQNVLEARVDFVNKGIAMRAIVNTLRTWAKDPIIKDETVIIPDECEKYGFVEGEHNVAEMLHFLADMLE